LQEVHHHYSPDKHLKSREIAAWVVMMEFLLHSAGCSSVWDYGAAVTQERVESVPFRRLAALAMGALKIWLTAANASGALQFVCQLVSLPFGLILTEMKRIVAAKLGSPHL